MNKQLTLEAFEKEWLLDITEGNPNTIEKGRRFAKKLVCQWLDLEDDIDSIDSDDLIYCDGTGDGGIDIAYLQRGDANEDHLNSGDTWYLIQSKYGTAFAGTTTLLIEAEKLFATLVGERTNLSSLATGLVEKIRTFLKQTSEKDKFFLIYAVQNPLSENENRIIEDIKAIGKQRLGDIFDVEVISLQTIYHRTLNEIKHIQKPQVSICAHLVSSGDDMLVGSVGLLQLYEFLKSYKATTGDIDLLYEKNVRKFLGSRRRVNKGIAETITNEPERFGLYNNGITVVVEDFKLAPNNIECNLTEPFIVNGCQTTKTIWEVLSRKLNAGGTGENLELSDWKSSLKKGIVVIKIVKVGIEGNDLLTKTTKYTNSQNAVSEKDFIVLERDFQKWSNEMADQYNVFLEIQRGGWDSQKAYQKQNPNTKQFSDHINAFTLLKVYGAAWLGEAGIAFGKNPPFAPGGSLFHKIVTQNDFALDDLYAAYGLFRVSERFNFGRGAIQPSRRQTRFLFYMMIVELLRGCINENITNKSITKSLLKLFKDENKQALDALLNFGIRITDSYLNQGHRYCVFNEPIFHERGADLNGFLKMEQLGKSSEITPHLLSLVDQHLIALEGLGGDQPNYKEMIVNIVQTDP